MYFLTHVCCLCLNSSNQKLYNLFHIDDDNLSFYDKLSTTLTNLIFNKNYEDYMLCTKCCININSVYEFNNRSIESLNTFLGYKEKLNSLNHESCEIPLRVVDIGDDNKSIQQDRSTVQKIEVIVDGCDLENEVTHSINVKLEKFEEFYNNIQHLVHSGSENSVELNTELVQDIKLELHVEDTKQIMDVASQGDGILEYVLGESEIKIEEPDLKIECFSDEVSAFDEVLDTCRNIDTDVNGNTWAERSHLNINDNIAHNQLGKNRCSRPSERECTEIDKQTWDKTNTRYEPSHSCWVQRSDVINEEPTNDTNTLNVTSPAGVDVLRIRKQSSSEDEESKQSSSLIVLSHTSYVCDVCSMTFKNSRNLAKHKVVHTHQKPHVCGTCKKGFIKSSELVMHKLIHTGQKPYYCDICEKGFSQSSYLISHKRSHKGQKPYICNICKKGFSNSSHLVRHKRIHTGLKPYVCDICNKGFSQSSILVRHKRIHSDQKSYVCNICKKEFSQSSHLNSHKCSHTGQKVYICDICKKEFSNSSHLVRHKRIHTGLKPYVCDVCNKGFSQSSILVRHKRIHTGQKPYVCNICKKRFSQSFYLVLHQRAQPDQKSCLKKRLD